MKSSEQFTGVVRRSPCAASLRTPTPRGKAEPLRGRLRRTFDTLRSDVVRREDGTYAVTKPGSQRASAVEPTQDAAVRRGSAILHNDGGGELRIHRRDGVIRDQRTIAPGNDPYPPKG
jgi:hypothetical protein